MSRWTRKTALVRSLYGKSPYRPQTGDSPHAVRKAGWCPECKRALKHCECPERQEPGNIFFDRRNDR